MTVVKFIWLEYNKEYLFINQIEHSKENADSRGGRPGNFRKFLC